MEYGGPVGERFAPTLAAEHLASEDGLQVDAETLRRWMLAQLRPGRVGSVIDQVDQATLRTALLQPVVKTAVHLHHLPKVLLALAPSPVPPLPLATPQPFRQHPASQRFGIHLQPILRCQVLRRQRRPEALTDRPTVLLAHQPQHLLPKLLLVSTMRWLSRAAVLQPRGAFLPIPLPQPLGLPAAHAHQPRRIHHPQLLAAHSRQHFYSSQLPLAHLHPPQSDLLSEVLFRGTFLSRTKGDIIIEAQQCRRLRKTGGSGSRLVGSELKLRA